MDAVGGAVNMRKEMGTMATTAVAFPILPGKTEEARRFAQEAMGPRQNEAAASFRRLAVTRETWHVQTTPMGDMVIVVMEAEDPAAVFEQWAASSDPFDRWFKQQAGAMTGLDFNTPITALPEQLFEWQG
jgi:hypothetical protein